MRQRDFIETLPQTNAVGIAGLQLHHQRTGAVGELAGVVETFLGGAVELFQISQFALGGGRVLFQIGQQHAELGAPVADVVLAHHLVTEEGQHARHGVTDDGGAQVADVHFLGKVRRGQIDYHALSGSGLAHAELAIGQCRIQAAGQRIAVLEEVQKARAGNLDLAHRSIGRQRSNQLLGQIARLHAGRLGQHHGDVAGEVTVRLVLGVLDLDVRGQTHRQYAVGGQSLKGLQDQLTDAVFHCAHSGGTAAMPQENGGLSTPAALPFKHHHAHCR